MSYEITEPAERDIKSILVYTLKVFGTGQLSVYEGIIDKGLAMVGADPDLLGSMDRSQIRSGIRLFHLELAVGRRGGASHCLYYTTGMMSNGIVGTIVLRVLGEEMEPRYKVVGALKQFASARTKPLAHPGDEDGSPPCDPIRRK